VPLAHVYNYSELLESFRIKCEIVNSNFETNIKIKSFLNILNYLIFGSNFTTERFFRYIIFVSHFQYVARHSLSIVILKYYKLLIDIMFLLRK